MPKNRRNKKRKRTKNKEVQNDNKKDNNIIIENNNNNENIEDNEEKNDLLKITNIDYEKFIKENNNLYEYLLNSQTPLLIQGDKFAINLESSSFIKIIKKAKLENEFKLYLTKQIITEEVNYETHSSKSITYNPKAQHYIKQIKNYNISFPSNNEGKSITIDKNIFEKIFSMMNLNYFIDIYTYITFIIVQISFKYKEKLLSYVLNDKNLKKLIEKNKIFYFLVRCPTLIPPIFSIPLSNYSTQKIFNLFNGGKDTKYLLIKYKIKDDNEIITYGLFLDKLINASDVKNLLIKYKEQLNNNTLKTLENKKLDKINEINITNLDIFLFSASNKLSDIITQINIKKDEIYKLSEKTMNQITSINIEENDKKFINRQYLELLQKNNSKNDIDNIIIYDINEEKISLDKKNFEFLENLIDNEEIYICMNYENENFLMKKNDILKIIDGWKILEQNENVNVIDIKEFNNIQKKIELMKIKIVEQKDIKEIIYNYKNKNKNRRRIDLFEYVKTLPKKKVYNIRYKHIVEKIHKEQNDE